MDKSEKLCYNDMINQKYITALNQNGQEEKDCI